MALCSPRNHRHPGLGLTDAPSPAACGVLGGSYRNTMNTPKHTPGPYALPLLECDMESVAADIAADSEWTTIHTIDEDGPADIVAACHRDNAPLLSAAPELLEALREAVKWLQSAQADEPQGYYNEPLDNAIEQALAAIAKAEGRQ